MISIKDHDGNEAVPDKHLAANFVAIAINEIADRHGYDLEFSSGLDRPTDITREGKNANGGSLHTFGRAWDYTLVYRPGTPKATQGLYEVIASELRSIIGKLFDIVVKPHGTGAHIHIEYDYKGRLG